MFHKFQKMLFYLTLKERLPRVPRIYANKIDPAEIDDDIARVMIYSQARDRRGVEILKSKYKVETVDELLALLPPNNLRNRAEWRMRLRRWLARLMGYTLYEPVVRPFIKQLKYEGLLSSDPTRLYATDEEGGDDDGS